METMADGKPCRTCTDFKTWAKLQKETLDSEKKSDKTDPASERKYKENIKYVKRRGDCPVDKDELGVNTWHFLHTVAAHYPKVPTVEQKKDMKTFFNLLPKVYPCHTCAEDLKVQLNESPPKVESQHQLSQWLCNIHNEINQKLDKPIFDCNLVNQRWRDGWLDGSCD